MLNESKKVRELVGHADPARRVKLPNGRPPAMHLIARAEATVHDEPDTAARMFTTSRRNTASRKASRRMVLATGVAAAASVALVGYNATRPRPHGDDPTEPVGVVLVPIAYQIAVDPPAAGEELRALAGRLVAAPYDSASGRYAYHHTKSWGDVRQGSPEGHWMSHVVETENWMLQDGSGRQRTRQLPPEFPDEQSRQYFQTTPGGAALVAASKAPATYDIPAQPDRGRHQPLPTGQAALADIVGAQAGGPAVAAGMRNVYRRHVIDLPSRAALLRVLADVDGFVWRGTVTDRAGRAGVAVSVEDKPHSEELVLVFGADGALLAAETVRAGQWLSSYELFLDYGRVEVAP